MALPYRGPFLLLYAVDRQLGALLRASMRTHPLTPDEFAVLSTLRLTGPIRAGELAALTGHPPTSMSNYLRRFEERGLLRRQRDPADRRATLVQLTDLGVADTVACFPGFRNAIDRFRDALEEEGVGEAQLLDQLEAVSRALGQAQARVDEAQEQAPTTMKA